MNKILVILAVLGTAYSSPVEPNVILKEDGSYKFNFDTGKEFGSIVRHEERHPDGTVVGRYSYEDPNGAIRVVNYRAGRQGFIASGDVGVDGAPPAQVPIVVPPVPEQNDPEEPGQDLQNIQEHNNNMHDAQQPTSPGIQNDVDKKDSSTVGPGSQAKSDSPTSKGDTVRVAIPDDTGRKREALSPSISYSDNFFPFEIPTFGKRRLEAPDDEDKTTPADDKTTTDDDTDKKQDPTQPPPSYISDALKPLNRNTGSDDAARAIDDPNTKPQRNHFYFPISPPFGFFPGTQQHQQPVSQNQYHSDEPRVWAYVPVSALSHQNSPFAPHTNWPYVQPEAVSYVPSGKNGIEAPGPTPSAPHLPPSSTSTGHNVHSHISPLPYGPTHGSPDVTSPSFQENPAVSVSSNVPQGQEHPTLHRPSVHHYHFRGPSDTYGYYYHY